MKKLRYKIMVILAFIVFAVPLAAACAGSVRITGFSIELNGQPYAISTNDTITIVEGQDVNVDGIVVRAKKSDKTTEILSLSDDEGKDGGYVIDWGTFNKNRVGPYIVTIGYKLFDEVEVKIQVIKRQIDHLTVTTQPDVKTYIALTQFDKTGMEVEVAFNDDSTAAVNNDDIAIVYPEERNHFEFGDTYVTLSYTYENVTKICNINDIVVSKATPDYETPTNLTATYGQKLSEITLPQGFSWVNPDDYVGNAGAQNHFADYTSADENYETVNDIEISIAVAKANPDYETPDSLNAVYGQLVNEISLPSGFAWNNPTDPVGNAGGRKHNVTYTPADTDNYEIVTNIEVTITVAKANPDYETPSNLTAVYGQQLNEISLPDGFAWENMGDFVGNAGVQNHNAVFTPADTDNYNIIADIAVEITVSKADPVVDVKPAFSGDYYIGKTKLPVINSAYAVVLGVNSESIEGTFNLAVNEPITVQATQQISIIFTPTDTDNYNQVQFEAELIGTEIVPVSITAEFNSGSAEIDTSYTLDELKFYLTVSVVYNCEEDNGTTNDYTLAFIGEKTALTVGNNEISVILNADNNITTTFNVQVSAFGADSFEEFKSVAEGMQQPGKIVIKESFVMSENLTIGANLIIAVVDEAILTINSGCYLNVPQTLTLTLESGNVVLKGSTSFIVAEGIVRVNAGAKVTRSVNESSSYNIYGGAEAMFHIESGYITFQLNGGVSNKTDTKIYGNVTLQRAYDLVNTETLRRESHQEMQGSSALGDRLFVESGIVTVAENFTVQINAAVEDGEIAAKLTVAEGAQVIVKGTLNILGDVDNNGSIITEGSGQIIGL